MRPSTERGAYTTCGLTSPNLFSPQTGKGRTAENKRSQDFTAFGMFVYADGLFSDEQDEFAVFAARRSCMVFSNANGMAVIATATAAEFPKTSLCSASMNSLHGTGTNRRAAVGAFLVSVED